MSAPYIKQVRVRDFGCVEDATLELTRLHALIGPNDSGKTTLLRAVRTALAEAHEQFFGSQDSAKPRDAASVTSLTGPSTALQMSVSALEPLSDLKFTFEHNAGTPRAEVSQQDKTFFRDIFGAWSPPTGHDRTGTIASLTGLEYFQNRAQWIHLDADVMREPSVLFTAREEIALGPGGDRLPAVYDAILNLGDDTFLRIAAGARQLFPSVKSIRLQNIANNTKAFEIELLSGQRVPASFVSDGLLYYLAFAALEHVSPASVLLIEEPENGLHPSRIVDVMRVLRRLAARVQVVIATHSPFVINELQGDEVTAVTRPEGKGTQVRRMNDTPNFAQRSKVYALGELWVSYADGKEEAPLLTDVDNAP